MDSMRPTPSAPGWAEMDVGDEAVQDERSARRQHAAGGGGEASRGAGSGWDSKTSSDCQAYV